MGLVMEKESNVVGFPTQNAAPQEGVNLERDALALAKLAVMPSIEYERIRVKMAKELGWRHGFLDQRVKHIKGLIVSLLHGYRPGVWEKGEAQVGRRVNFDGIVAFEVARSVGEREIAVAVVLADDGGTCKIGYIKK